MGGNDRASIVFTHWAMNEERSNQMRDSIYSLMETADGAEIIVVDNGEDISDSMFLLDLCHQGKVASYTRYRKNMHFYYARNDGLKRASRDYFVISDNDILFKPGWLDECIDFLVRNPGKYLATPIAADPMNSVRKERWCGDLDGWRLNYRAGSNIFVGSRETFNDIGEFDQLGIAGSKWVDRYVRKGYKMAVMPEPKAFDMGLRKGYNISEPIKNTEL